MATNTKTPDELFSTINLENLGKPGIDDVTSIKSAEEDLSFQKIDPPKENKFAPVDFGSIDLANQEGIFVESAREISGFDPTKYQKELGSVYYNDAMDKSRAILQSTGDLWKNSIGQMTIGIGADIISNIAGITDFGSYIVGEGDVVGNEFSRWAQDLSNDVSDAFPIYRENPNEVWDVGDASWWIGNGVGVVRSAGAFLGTGAGVGGALGALGKLGKIMGASKNALNVYSKASTVANAVMLNQAESMLDAVDVYDTIYKEYMEAGMSEEDSRVKASSAAAHTINANRVNIALNLTSASMFTKAPMISRRTFSKSWGKKILGESAQEYMEEVINLSARERGMASAYGEDTNIARGITDAFFSKEGTEAGFWGAVGGAMQTGGSIALDVDGARKNSRMQEDYIRQFDEQRKNSKKNSLYSVGLNLEKVNSLVTEMNEAYERVEAAISNGEDPSPADVGLYERNRADLLMTQAYAAFSTGSAENLQSYYEGIMGMDNSEASEFFTEDILDGKTDHKEMAKKALEKIKIYEKIFNEVGDLKYDKGKAYRHKISIDHSNDVEKTFLEGKSVAMASLQMNVIDNYFKSKGKDTQVINYKDLSDIEKSDPGLYSAIVNSKEYARIISSDKVLADIAKNKTEHFKKFEEIISSDYQAKAAKESKNAPVKNERSKNVKQSIERITKLMNSENPTKESLQAAMLDLSSFGEDDGGMTPESLEKTLNQIKDKIAEIERKNVETFEEKEEGLTPDPNEDTIATEANPAGKDETSNFVESLDDKQLERRNLIFTAFNEAIEKGDPAEINQVMDIINDSDLLLDSEKEQAAEYASELLVAKEVENSEDEGEALKKKTSDAFYSQLEGGDVDFNILDDMLSSMAKSGLFNKTEMTKFAKDGNEYLDTIEAEEAEVDNDIADDLEGLLGEVEIKKPIEDQVEEVIDEETKGMSKTSKNKVLSAIFKDGEIMSEEESNKAVDDIESKSKSKTNSKIVKAINAIRAQLKKILMSILLVLGTYFGTQSTANAAELNNYMGQNIQTEMVSQMKAEEESMPIETQTAGAEILMLLAAFVRRKNRKGFDKLFKESYPKADPDVAWEIISKKHEDRIKDAKSKKPARISIANITAMVPIKRNIDQIRNNILGKVEEFILSTNIKSTLNDMSRLYQRDGKEYQDTRVIGSVNDENGEHVGVITVSILNGQASISLMETKGETIVKTIPIETISADELFQRINKGYVTSNVGMNKVKFEANMISAENMARESLIADGVDPDTAPVASDPDQDPASRSDTEEEIQSKEESEDRKIVKEQKEITPPEPNIPWSVDGAPVESTEPKKLDQKEINRRANEHLPKSYGGHVMGQFVNGKFQSLYDQYGGLVESEFIEGNNLLNVFDRIYSQEPSVKESGQMFFLGKEASMRYSKTGDTSEAFYRMKIMPGKPSRAKASEIFATNDSGALLINTPEIKVGDKVTLIRPTEAWKWFKKGGLSEDVKHTAPILIYRAQDIVDGKPTAGALPLDMFSTSANTNNSATITIRNFFENPKNHQMTLVIETKSDGYVKRGGAGDLPGGHYKLGEREGSYERNEDGSTEWKPKNKLSRDFPMIMVIDGEGGVFMPKDSPTTSIEKDLIEESAVNFSSSENNLGRAGVSVMVLMNANGSLSYSSMIQRRLDSTEKDYVYRNMSTLLRTEIELRKNDKTIDYSVRDLNYVKGLSEVIATNHISIKDREALITGEKGFDKLYKEGAINFTDNSVIMKRKDGLYVELSILPRQSKNERLQSLIPSALDMIIAGPALEWKEMYDPAADESTRAVWVEEIPNETPFYKSTDSDGNYLTKSGRSVVVGEGKKIYHKAGPHIGSEIRKDFMEKFDLLRRNVLIRNDNRTLLNDEKTSYVDPVNPGKTYESYMHFLNDTVVVQHDVNTKSPVSGSNIYLQNQKPGVQFAPETFEEIPIQAVSEKEKSGETVMFMGMKQDSSPQKENLEKGTIPDRVNIAEETGEPATVETDLQAQIAALDPEGRVAKKIKEKGWDPNNEKDAIRIAALLENSFRVASRKEVADKNFKVISSFEAGWMDKNFGGRTTVVKAVDHVLSQGKVAWGYYFDGLTTVAQGAKSGTAYHEAFHLVFDLGLNDKQKSSLLKEAKAKYKGRTNIESDENRSLEEFMADEFMVHMLKRENGEVVKKGKIAAWFDHIIFMIKNALGLRTSMESLFNDIGYGGYQAKLSKSNSWNRLTPMNMQIINYVGQEIAVNYIKSNIAESIVNITHGINIANKSGDNKGPKDLDSWMRKYSNNLFDRLLKFDEDGKPESGQIFEDYQYYDKLMDSDAFLDKSKEEQNQVARMVNVLESVMDNWSTKVNDTGVEKSGFRDHIISLLNSAGIPVKLRNSTLEGVDAETYKIGDKVFEYAEMLSDGVSPNSKEHIHDMPVYFLDTRESLDTRVKSWLFFTPVYEFNNNGTVKRRKDGKKLIAKDNVTLAQRTINFDKVYNKLKTLLVDKDFDDMIESMATASITDDEIGSIWEAIKESQKTNSNIYESFFSHFNMTRKNMIMVMDKGFGEFKFFDANSKTLVKQLTNAWRANASFYTISSEMENVIDRKYAKKVNDYSKDFVKWYNTQTSSKKSQMTLEDNKDAQKELINEMILRGDALMRSIGIEVDPNIWEEIKVKDFVAAKDKLSKLFFGKEVKKSDKDRGKRVSQVSVTGLATTLNKGIDIYVEEGTTMTMIANFVKAVSLDVGSDSFISVDGKTVYSVNMNNHLSLLMKEFKGSKYQESVNRFHKDGFYKDNLFLEMLSNPEFRNRLGVHYLDGIRNDYTKVGADFEQSSIAQSIQTRIAIFFQSSGDYTLINNGTKGDKSQSVYTKIMRLDRIKKDTSTMDMAKDILKRTVNQERFRIDRINKMKANPALVRKIGIKNFLRVDAKGIFSGNGDKFNYIPALNLYDNMVPFSTDETSFSDKDTKLAEREKIVNQEIDALLEMVIKEGLEEMINNGIITRNDQGEYESVDRVTPNSISGNIEANATEFLINEFIWNLELNKVFMGDLAGYKTNKKTGDSVVDYFKRSYQLITPGKDIFMSEGRSSDESFQSIIMNDIVKVNDFEAMLSYARYVDENVSEEYVRQLYDLKVEGKELSIPESLDMSKYEDRKKFEVISAVDNFYSVNKTDGQSYANIEWHKQVMIKAYAWDNSHDFMYNKYWKDDAEIFEIFKKRGNNVLSESELIEIADGPKLEPHKPFYYGERWSEEHQQIIHEQYKNHVFVLTRLMAESFDDNGYNYRQLYDTMNGKDGRVKWNNKKRLILYDSAVKIGSYGEFDYDTKDNIVTRESLMRNLRFPQVINAHDSLSISSGAQAPKVAIDNVQDEYSGYEIQDINDVTKDPLNGKEVKALFNSAWAHKIEISKKNLAKELSLREDFSQPQTNAEMLLFLSKVRDVIRNSIIDRDLPDNYIEAIDLVKTIEGSIKFKMPLDFPLIGNKYENLIATMFRNSVLRQKLHGDSMAQLADYGTRKSGEKFTKPSDELKFIRREDGKIMAAEIGVPARIIRSIIGIDMPIGKIDQSMLTDGQKEALMIIGYRIPTQSKSSILPMVIARVIPDTYGASMMVPGEISVQQGSDYDIDKMFLIMRHYDKDTKDVVKFNNPFTKTGKYSKKNDIKQVDNLIFNITWAILNSDNHTGELLSPLDSKQFSSIVKEYQSIDGTPTKWNTVAGEKMMFEKKRKHHVAAFHTNIMTENLNKFAKAAVGIIGLASSAKAYYTTINARLRLKKDRDTKTASYRDKVYIHTNKDDKARDVFTDTSDDGQLVTDFLKELGSAALDNANDPLLGYLDVNIMTINTALLLGSLGYTRKVIFDFLKQPILRRLSVIYANQDSSEINFAIAKMLKEMPPNVKDHYEEAKNAFYQSSQPVRLNSSKMNGYLGESINNTSKPEFIQAQAKILVAFKSMFRQGNSLSALNKRLAPEMQSKLNGLAQLYRFRSLQKLASSDMKYDNFTIKKGNSPTARIEAYYDLLSTYSQFAKNLFVNQSKFFTNSRTMISGLTSSRKSDPGQFNTMTSAISYMVLTKHTEGFKSLIGSDSDVRKLFFSPDNKALADDLVALKNDPKFMNENIIAALDISFWNDYSYIKQIKFNNSTDRSVGEKNAIQDSWSKMLQSSNPLARNFAEKLIPFFIISSGLDMNFNTAHEYIPLDFWTDASKDYIGYWERTTIGLKNGSGPFSGKDALNIALQYARANPKSIPSISLDLTLEKDDSIKSKYVNKVEDKKTRLKSTKANTKDLQTYDIIELNAGAKRAMKGSKFRPFIKYNVTTKGSNQKKVAKLSGFRLLALVDVVKDEDGKHLQGTYQEVQWLGGLDFNETDLSKNNPTSIHPANSNTDSFPDEGYYFQKGDEAYNKTFGIAISEAKPSEEPKKPAEGTSNEVLADPDLENMDPDDVPKETEEEEDFLTSEEEDDKGSYSLEGTSVSTSEEVTQEVRNKVTSFLERLGVSVEVVTKLKEKYGLPVEAVAKIGNRTIEVANEDTMWKDLPEEAAHFYVEGLAGEKEMDTLIRRAKKDPLYQEVVKQYGEAYGYDENRLARETAAKLIARHMINGESVSKNWLRNILNKIKDMIERIFKGADPFKLAANNILDENFVGKLNTSITNNDMYSLGEDTTLDESDAMVRTDKIGEHNLKRLNKTLKSVKSSISKKLKRINDPQVKARMSLLNSQLDIDQGLKFMDAYTKEAMNQSSFVMSKLKTEMSNSSKTHLEKITFLNKHLLDWLGAYDQMASMTAVVQGIYNEQNLPLKSRRIYQMNAAGNMVQSAKETINEELSKLFAEEMSKYSNTDETAEQIYDSMLFAIKDIGILDFGIKSLSDTDDSLMSRIAKVIRIRMKEAEDQFLTYLRGGREGVGSAKATKEFLKGVDRGDLKEIYKNFTTYDKESDQYKFVSEESAHNLTAREKKFYDAVILPYITHRRKLHKYGLKHIIKDPLNIPMIKKGVFEAKSLSTATENVKDRFKFVEGEDDSSRTDESGNLIKSIPIRYQATQPSDKISMDIPQILAASMENLLFADNMSKIEHLVATGLEIMKRRPYVNTDKDGNPVMNEIISPNTPLVLEKFEALRDAIFYGEREKGYNKALFGVVDTRKLSGAVRGTISYSNLAFNLFAQFINPLVMAFFSLSKAIGGTDYTIKDWAKSAGGMFGDAAGMFADFNSKAPTRTTTLIMERIGVFSHGVEDVQMSKGGSLFKNFFSKLGYSGFKLGNAMVQPLTARAFMLNKKITLKDGSEITMWDAYEKSGDALVVRKDVIEAIGEDGFATMEIAVKEMVRGISDNEGLSDAGYLQQKWWGKFIMMHRSWMGPMFENLYGAVRPDTMTGKMKGGTLKTTLTLLAKGLKAENRYMLKALWGHSTHLKPGDLDPFTNKAFTKESLELYRSNVKQFIFHILTISVFGVLGALASDDEDDLTKAEKLAKLVRLRFVAELSSMIHPGDIYRVLKHPTAAITYMDNIGKLVSHILPTGWGDATDVLESGRYKGDTKFEANIKRLAPFEKQFSKFEDVDSLIGFYE